MRFVYACLSLSTVLLPLLGCDGGVPQNGATHDGKTGAHEGIGATTLRTTHSTATTPATEPSPSTERKVEPHERLYGTWVARDVDTSLGEVKIELTLREEGPLKLMAWSDMPFVGQVRNKAAPFEVDGNTISSDAIRGGTSVEYWFDGGQLVVRYKEGKLVRFERKKS